MYLRPKPHSHRMNEERLARKHFANMLHAAINREDITTVVVYQPETEHKRQERKDQFMIDALKRYEEIHKQPPPFDGFPIDFNPFEVGA